MLEFLFINFLILHNNSLKIGRISNYFLSFIVWRLVFWNSIHLEVASDSFCFLLYSSWLLVFILYVFELFFSFINLIFFRLVDRCLMKDYADLDS